MIPLRDDNPSSIVPVVSWLLLRYLRGQVLVLMPFGVYSRIVHVPAGTVLGLWFVYQTTLESKAKI